MFIAGSIFVSFVVYALARGVSKLFAFQDLGNLPSLAYMSVTIVTCVVKIRTAYQFWVQSTSAIRQVCASVAAILKAERLRQGLSLTRVSEQAGLSRQMIGYVEKGMRTPTVDTLLRIAGVLDLDAADILRRAQRRR
jgi:DNA-binding XRE family transcriptional regulator